MFAGTHVSCVPTQLRMSLSLIGAPVKAQVQLKDISMVEIVGGTTYIPALEAQLSKKAGHYCGSPEHRKNVIGFQ